MAARWAERVTDEHEEPALLGATDLEVDIHSDLRRKGLHWFSLYDVKLAGAYRYTHERTESGVLEVIFELPDRFDARVIQTIVDEVIPEWS